MPRIACLWKVGKSLEAEITSTRGPWSFNIKMSSYQYKKAHCADNMVIRLSFLHDINSILRRKHLYIGPDPWWPRCFNLKMSSCQFRKSCCSDKTISGLSYLFVMWAFWSGLKLLTSFRPHKTMSSGNSLKKKIPVVQCFPPTLPFVLFWLKPKKRWFQAKANLKRQNVISQQNNLTHEI